jgi:hypothetical protein
MVRDLGARAAPSLRTSGRSVPRTQAVCDAAGGRLLRSGPRSRLPGGTPSGRRDPRLCLGVDRPAKAPQVDVEPKRGKDSR